MNPTVLIVVVIVSSPVRRDPPSSSIFPAAPAIDTTGELVSEQPSRSNVIPLRAAIRKVG